ncbi:InlB B-repeat-containing protein [Rhodoluna sp.]|uniref:InlB B-repeat-containing protein n=1 Tax=Rhodoluna sp. TaxID=1969481 RepID=UPI0025E47AED|nr:InlB B-repeat-containing protein [Rhodoluna sp.]
MKSILSMALALTFGLVGALAFVPSAKAATVVDVSGVELDFSSSKRTATSTPTALNGTATYTNVATVGGVQIDARVTTVALQNSSVDVYDSPGSASANEKYFQINNTTSVAGGFTSFKFDFYDHADGSVAVLKNVSVTSIDLDSPGRQFTEFNGFQSYVFSTDTKLTAYTTNHTGGALANGLVRFVQTRTNAAVSSSNDPFSAVEVKFDQMSSYTAVFGNEVAQGGFYGVSFKGLCATATGSACGARSAVSNPNNSPPTSQDTTRYYDLTVPAILSLANFPYSDPDGNAFTNIKVETLPSTGTLQYFNGTAWVNATVGLTVSVANIELGYLRYSGSGSSFTYKVSDGTLYSTAANTVNLLGAPNGQIITFTNPGNKTPTAPNFASNAAADSGLTVVLTSLTPSVCVVSGLDIDPIATGACTIVASQPGNANYGAATNVTQTFYITTDASQTITFVNPGDQSWSGSSFTVPTTPTATSGLTVTLTSFSPAVCTISGTTITVVGPGTCQIRATQAGGASGGTTYAAAPPVTISYLVSAPVVASYTITYDGNGATSGTAPSDTTGNGSVSLATNSSPLAKLGFTFAGWNTQADGTGTNYTAGASYTLSADITLYAKWTIVVSPPTLPVIDFSGNGSNSGGVPPQINADGSITVPGNVAGLIKGGYVFTGWNSQPDGKGTHFEPGDRVMLSTGMTLYAEWAPIIEEESLAETGAEVQSSALYAFAVLMMIAGAILSSPKRRSKH